MSQELLYTSAPHGLKLGSRGFCTVLSTHGMPAPLASGLEALSGYRPVYPSSDSRAHLNPVVQSHVTLPVAGRSWHVLSRIADYGLDYSQRTNKLAHHVVLDPGELIPGGPAYLLSIPAFMRTEWNEEPHLVAPKPVKKAPPTATAVCRAWKELTGDAGWAGVLAESFLRDPERPVFLLYEPGQDVLPLMAEAISLLPVERRWEVTFSTYFNGIPQGVTCAWRCMLNDSPEAHQSLRFVKALRLDLTSESLGIATGGSLVDLARVGGPLTVTAAQSVKRAASQPGSDQKQHVSEHRDQKPSDDADSDQVIVEDKIPLARAEPPSLVGAAKSNYSARPQETVNRSKGRKTLADVNREHDLLYRRRFLLIGLLLGMFGIFSGGAFSLIALRSKPNPHPQEQPQAVSQTAKPDSQPSHATEVPPPQTNEKSDPSTSAVASTSPDSGVEKEKTAAAAPSLPSTVSSEQSAVTNPQKEPLRIEPKGMPDEILNVEFLKKPGVQTEPPPAETLCKFPIEITKNITVTLLQPTKPKFSVVSQKKFEGQDWKYSIGKLVGMPDEVSKTFSPHLHLKIKSGTELDSLEIKRVFSDASSIGPLKWCYLDIQDADRKFWKRVKFFDPSITNVPSALELKEESDWALTWPLPLPVENDWMPELKIDRVSLRIADEDFEFSNSEPGSSNGTTSAKFIEFIHRSFPKILPIFSPEFKIGKVSIGNNSIPTVTIKVVKYPEIQMHVHPGLVKEFSELKTKYESYSPKPSPLMNPPTPSPGAPKDLFRKDKLPTPEGINFAKNAVKALKAVPTQQTNLTELTAIETSLDALRSQIEIYDKLAKPKITSARLYYELFEPNSVEPCARNFLVDFKIEMGARAVEPGATKVTGGGK